MLVPAPAQLPVPEPTTSYWQSPPSRLQKFRSTNVLPDQVDYLIVGGGVSGSSLAYHILKKNPKANILLLEARDACGGASGRNGGHCRPGNYVRFVHDMQFHGIDEAAKMARFEETNVRHVAALVKEHKIDCLLEPVTTVDLYETGAEDLFAETLDAIAARKIVLAPEITAGKADERIIYTAREAREKFKMPNAVGAVSFPAYSINPYRFVCGVLEIALRMGLNLQTGTPVDRIEYSEQKGEWFVETSRGKVRATNLFLATNGYTSHLLPRLSRSIMPVRNQAVALRSGSKISETQFLQTHSICFNYGTNQPGVYGSDYMVSKPPKTGQSADIHMGNPANGLHHRDIVLGGGRHLAPHHEEFNSDDSTIDADVAEYLRHALQTTHFGPENWGPDNTDSTICEWTGIVGHTPDSNPVLGQWGSGSDSKLWLCAGFTGHGMAMAFRGADAVSSLALGGEYAREADEWLPHGFRSQRLLNGPGVGVPWTFRGGGAKQP